MLLAIFQLLEGSRRLIDLFLKLDSGLLFGGGLGDALLHDELSLDVSWFATRMTPGEVATYIGKRSLGLLIPHLVLRTLRRRIRQLSLQSRRFILDSNKALLMRSLLGQL